MAPSQGKTRAKATPDVRADNTSADLESRVASLETTLESIAAEGIRAKIESPELVAELVATHGLDDLASRLADLESVFNNWEGTERPDLMMRMQDLERRIDELESRTEETVRTVAQGLAEMRAVMRDLSEQIAIEGDEGAAEV